MKNDNKAQKYTKIFVIALIGVMLLTACSNMFNDPINGSEGKVRIELTQGNARSVFPLMVFDRYEYFFTKIGETIPVEKIPDGGGLFTLDIADYTVEVLAYTDNDTLAARGVSAQFSVNPGSNVTINVPLSSAISVGQGQFSYTITYPLGTAEVTLQRWSDMSSITLAPVSQGNGISQTLNNLESGSYLFTVKIIKDELIAGISEAIHIYPSITTEYRKDFSDNELLVIPISTAAQLNAVRNNLVGRYILVNNIDLSGNWTPIGTSANPFTGIFDGNGYTISGLTINSNNISPVGLFGDIGSSGIIKNLGLINVNITNNNQYGTAGGIVGWNYGIVQNCYVTGIVTGAEYTGGIVGVNRGTVQNCYVTGIVTGAESGGIVGSNWEGLVQKCYSNVTVTGSMVGGIVGYNRSNSIVQNCYSMGDVINNSSSGWSGGIVGNNSGPVLNCYSTGSVYGITLTGGIIGNHGLGILINCVALNPKVIRLEGTYSVYGRVVSSTSTGSISNNYGRNGMIVITTSITTGNHNDRHGANVLIEQAVTPGWWNAPAAGWDASSPWDFVNVWHPADGTRLPTLRNMPGGNTQNPVIQF